jgi:DNA-binding transcriptional LysR family regulator
LRLVDGTLSGTLYTLTSGQADLAIGVIVRDPQTLGLRHEEIGSLMQFVFAVAPHHPLANMPQPLSDAVIQAHRAVAVADSVPQGNGITIGLLAGQDVFTVPSMRAKLDAQLRGLGAGFLPEPMARPYIDQGLLVECQVMRPHRTGQMAYAWREPAARQGPVSHKALKWWLTQLARPSTRQALLGQALGATRGAKV